MATIPTGQKFHTVPSNVETQERGSALAKSQREIYTMQDIVDTVQGALPPSAPQMYITVLDQSGTNSPTTNDVVADFVPDVVTRNSAGNYTLIFPSGTFTSKTIATITLQGSNPVGLVGVVGLTLNWDINRIDIITKNPSLGTASDGYLSGARLSVQVYE